MKKWLRNTLVILVCVKLGYMFYPVVNTSDEDVVLAEESPTIVNEPVLAPVVEEVPIKEEVEEITQTIASNENNKPSVLESELQRWSADHKNRISELIHQYMSNDNAEHMKYQILKDNDYFVQPSIKQDSVIDSYWSSNMEVQLKSLIESHEQNEKFELLHISCKQLMCDILGIEKEENTWFNLYVSLLQKSPSVDFPDGNNNPKSVVHMENDVAVVYSQIRFKSS